MLTPNELEPPKLRVSVVKDQGLMPAHSGMLDSLGMKWQGSGNKDTDGDSGRFGSTLSFVRRIVIPRANDLNLGQAFT